MSFPVHTPSAFFGTSLFLCLFSLLWLAGSLLAGGTIYLAWVQRRGRGSLDPRWDELGRLLSTLLLGVATSAGGLLGGAVWFAGGVLYPGMLASTAGLLLWPLACGWGLYLLGVLCLALCRAKWDGWRGRETLRLGLTICAAGAFSVTGAMAVLIRSMGLLGAGTVPAGLAWTRSVGRVSFPDFLHWGFLSLAAAGALGLLYASWQRDSVWRRGLAEELGLWSCGAALAAAATGAWWIASVMVAVPGAGREEVDTFALWAGGTVLLEALLGGFLYRKAVLAPRRFSAGAAILGLGLSLLAMGGIEGARAALWNPSRILDSVTDAGIPPLPDWMAWPLAGIFAIHLVSAYMAVSLPWLIVCLERRGRRMRAGYIEAAAKLSRLTVWNLVVLLPFGLAALWVAMAQMGETFLTGAMLLSPLLGFAFVCLMAYTGLVCLHRLGWSWRVRRPLLHEFLAMGAGLLVLPVTVAFSALSIASANPGLWPRIEADPWAMLAAPPLVMRIVSAWLGCMATGGVILMLLGRRAFRWERGTSIRDGARILCLGALLSLAGVVLLMGLGTWSISSGLGAGGELSLMDRRSALFALALALAGTVALIEVLVGAVRRRGNAPRASLAAAILVLCVVTSIAAARSIARHSSADSPEPIPAAPPPGKAR